MPKRFPLAFVALAAISLASAEPRAQAPVIVSHGIAMHGEPKYKADFKHFAYASPNAVKGGEIKLEASGTFDNFNIWILGGTPAGAVGSTIESLMVGAADEAFTEYCLICETVEYPADRSWVAFTLRPQARWHDGKPITVEDVIFSLDILKTKGHPAYRSYWASVEKAEKVGDRKVRFSFVGEVNRELPLIVGQLPILPKHYWETRDFTKTTLEPPLGSGAYKIDSFEAGRYIVLRRVTDYWGKDLPARVGQGNFDAIRFDYYRDRVVALEAFKAGEFDIRVENQALAWATRYVGQPFDQGLIKREEIEEEAVSGMQGFIMNSRREPFTNAKVREAFAHAFDFEWSNRNLFYGAYTRTRSYFDNSELAARGLPSKEELALLEPLRQHLPPEVFTKEYHPPKTDGTGNWRDGQREATRLLREAGWTVRDGKLVNARNQQMKVEFMLDAGGQFERIALPYLENLKRLGIDATARSIDIAQYQRRREEFDFDMIVSTFGQSESPGNEQRNMWTTRAAETKGSNNLTGVKNPALDQLVELLITADTREDLITRTRALDRALQWSHLVVPNWHVRTDRVAYWDRFSRPPPHEGRKIGYAMGTWWVDPAKDAALRQRRPR
jgi:microcin C transport system substrate-binding protein